MEDIAEVLEVELSQLLINPQQLFSTNNKLGYNAQHNGYHQQEIDKNIVDRMMGVMEKMTALFAEKKSS